MELDQESSLNEGCADADWNEPLGVPAPDFASTPLAALHMSVRLRRFLGSLHLTTVAQACELTVNQCMSVPQFGFKSLTELQSVLEPFLLVDPNANPHQRHSGRHRLTSREMDRVAETLTSHALASSREKVLPRQVARVIQLLETPLSEAVTAWNMPPSAIQIYADHLLSLANSMHLSNMVDPAAEVAGLTASLGDRHRQVVELRFGLQDGRERTLEEVGDYIGVTRERSRQILKVAEDALSKYRPPLPLIRPLLDDLGSRTTPVSFEHWLNAHAVSLDGAAPRLSCVLEAIQRWGWVEPLTICECHQTLYAIVGAERELEIRRAVRATARSIHLLRQLVAVTIDQVTSRSDLDATKTVEFLLAHGAEISHDRWIIWPEGQDSWLRTRVAQMLSELGSLTVATAYRGLKRQSTHWKRVGSPCPPSPVLGRALRRCGFLVDRHGIIQTEEHLTVAPITGAERLVIDTLRRAERPLTITEVTRGVLASGGKESMAMFFLSQSPMVEQVERGIFTVRGQAHAVAGYQQAREERTREGPASAVGEVVQSDANEIQMRFDFAVAKALRAVYIPQNAVPEGDWLLVAEYGDTRIVTVRPNYISGILDMFRAFAARGQNTVHLRFMLKLRACEVVSTEQQEHIL